MKRKRELNGAGVAEPATTSGAHSNGKKQKKTTEPAPKKSKKKVRIDETESLKIKKQLAEEPHFSAKELPAKIIKSKLNKNLTEEVKKVGKRDKKAAQIKKTVSSSSSEDEDDDDDKGGGANGLESLEGSKLEAYFTNREAKKKLPKQTSFLMPKEDQLMLVERIQEHVPSNDTKSYKYSTRLIDWQKVAFKNYTVEDCQKGWEQLFKKVRHYRLLIEILHDVKNVIELVDMADGKSTKSKSSSLKHPDMPKRPPSSYFMYLMKNREKIAKERPDLAVGELNKFISEKYQNLPIENKQKYDNLAAKKREEYKERLEEFYSKHPDYRPVIKKQPRKEAKEKPPKRPDNPSRLFMQSESVRDGIIEDDKVEFKEICRERWRQLSDEQKLHWINLAEQMYVKYEEDLRNYMAKYPDYTPKNPPQKAFLTREEVNLKDKLAGKPKKPPSTAYGLFISITLQSANISNILPRERWNYTSARWKALTDEERDRFKHLLTQVHEQYQKDFDAYLDSLPEDKREAEMLQNVAKKRKSTTTTTNTAKPSTSGTKPKATKPATAKPATKPAKVKIENPIPPPRSTYKYFAEKYEGANAKEAWKALSSTEKKKYDVELEAIKDKYIQDFEAYLNTLSRKELAAFSESRKAKQEHSSSDESESDSSSNKSSDESFDSSDDQ